MKTLAEKLRKCKSQKEYVLVIGEMEITGILDVRGEITEEEYDEIITKFVKERDINLYRGLVVTLVTVYKEIIQYYYSSRAK